MSRAAHAYFATQIATTTQGQLLLMLYDGAIKFLKQARVKIEERNYAQKGILISKAIDIISELNQSLNKEKGGRIAENLNSLYMFCSMQLAKANIRMNVKMVDEVINILQSLRQAYAEIVPTHEDDARQPAPVAGVAAPRAAAPPLSSFPTLGAPARLAPPIIQTPRPAAPAPKP
ncbi:MAG: flagellar export chaperone FliS, partial [Desulfovibrionaceae bacterium]